MEARATTDLTVANTILAQLGGRRFMAMTGAKLFTGFADALSFRFPLQGGRGANYCKITLTDADVYDLEFLTIRGMRVTPCEKREGIYCDQLREVFSRVTGLVLDVPRVRFGGDE